MKRIATNTEDSSKKFRQEAISSRTVYLGSVPLSTTNEEILDNVKGGAVENIRRIPEKGCLFVDFLDSTGAQNFYDHALANRIIIGGSDIKVGWGKPCDLSTNLLMAYQSGASRNIFIGGIDAATTVESLRKDMEEFGEIDNIRIFREKKIAFVHFVSISDALVALASLSRNEKYSGKRINYGKDRCAQPISVAPVMNQPVDYSYYANYYQSMMAANAAANQPPAGETAQSAEQSRTIYLGGLHPETSAEDLCNVIRGGALQNIKVVPEKKCAFVTFIDPNGAYAFYAFCHYQGVLIRGHRLKVGWGKSSPISASIAMVLDKGASRNVYLGNVPESLTIEKLNSDFSSFGMIESTNIIKAKNIAFVNFCNITTAMKVVENGKQLLSSEYRDCRIAYGRDRCASVDAKTLLAPLSQYYSQYASMYNMQYSATPSAFPYSNQSYQTQGYPSQPYPPNPYPSQQ